MWWGAARKQLPAATFRRFYIDIEARRAYQRDYMRARRAKGIKEDPAKALDRVQKWRKDNRAYYNAAEMKRYRRRRQEIYDIKLERGCERCGYNEHPAALDFHHVTGTKDFNIAESVRHSRERLKAEIAKCIVLCSNCHRVEHFKEVVDAKQALS